MSAVFVAVDGMVSMKTKWVIRNFIHLKAFFNPQNGYHIYENCVVCVEVFMVINTVEGERL